MRRRAFLTHFGTGLAALAASRPALAQSTPPALSLAELRGSTNALEFDVRPGALDNQSVAFQRMIDETARRGIPVFLPAGTYVISNIKLPDGAIIAGVPGRTQLVYGGDGHFLSGQALQQVRLSGLVIDGANRWTGAGTDGLIDLRGVTDATLDELTVRGAGEVNALNITVEESAVEVEGIVVEAARERGSQAFLLDERRTSNAVVEGIGSTEIGRRADSDAAEVAQRLTGVTVSEGKYVFVRGLGERYSQTSLNGSSLPSPEPEREVVPLDLFPSGFLESLQTQKTYTPDLPADFSGGSVKIETKDFPNQFVVRLGASTSFNTNSQFEDGFLAYPGGGRDWLGFDDGTRDQPRTVADIMGPVSSGQRLPSDPQQLIEIGRSLQSLEQGFQPVTKTTPFNRSFNGSLGGRSDAFDDGELGYFLAGTYGDSYTYQPADIERKWRVSAFSPDVPEDNRRPNVDYTFTRGTRNVSWGTIGNLTVKPNPDQKVSLRTTVNLSTEDEARSYQGENREDIGGIVRSDRLRFVSRLMLWSQLSGEHALFGDAARLEWRATAARANRDEPMLRESIYLKDGDDPFFLLPIGESGRYFWSELTDDDLSGALDLTLPFEFAGEDASLKVGGEYRNRTRDFAARRLNWDFIGGSIESIDEALRDAAIVTSVRNTGEFGIQEVVERGEL